MALPLQINMRCAIIASKTSHSFWADIIAAHRHPLPWLRADTLCPSMTADILRPLKDGSQKQPSETAHNVPHLPMPRRDPSKLATRAGSHIQLKFCYIWLVSDLVRAQGLRVFDGTRDDALTSAHDWLFMRTACQRQQALLRVQPKGFRQMCSPSAAKEAWRL